MKTTTISLFFSLLFFICLSAQTTKINPSDTIPYNSSIDAVSDTIPNLDIFDDETPMNLTLKYDITSFIKNKVEGEYLKAELFIEYEGYTNTKNIKLKARGNNRRERCFFPPIYLNFKKDPIENSELKGFKKIKLVTHCSSSKLYTNYILKEYLVYKLYNILTDKSFRVKLLNLKYIDTGKKEKNYEKNGFLIEPIELVAKRNKSMEFDGTRIREEYVYEEEADMVALFHYMIGNTDWRIKSGHNTKFLKLKSQLIQKVIPIPYDFDYAGFVGTSYSHPQTWTSLNSVREREYLGYCRNDENDYLKTIKLFKDKKKEILETIANFEYLEEADKNSLINYIEEFYSKLDQPKKFLSVLKNQCRSNEF